MDGSITVNRTGKSEVFDILAYAVWMPNYLSIKWISPVGAPYPSGQFPLDTLLQQVNKTTSCVARRWPGKPRYTA